MARGGEARGDHHHASRGENRTGREARPAAAGVESAKNGLPKPEESPQKKKEEPVVLKPLIKTSSSAIKLTLNSVSHKLELHTFNKLSFSSLFVRLFVCQFPSKSWPLPTV